MKIHILEDIPFNPSASRLIKRMRVKKDSRQADSIREMVDQATKLGKPKALYSLAGIDKIDDAGVTINGIRLESRILAVNFSDIHRVFPYIVTCGRELYDWKESQEDLIKNYYADEIGAMALKAADNFLMKHLRDTYQPRKTSSINPGSLPDWPITTQPDLFNLLGNQENSIGVELLDSMLMLPNQTVSGIEFESEEGYSSCELCPRENCSHRRTPYNPALLKDKYFGD